MSVRASPSLALLRRSPAFVPSSPGRLPSLLARPSSLSPSPPTILAPPRRFLSLTPVCRSQNAAQDPYTSQNGADDVNVKQKVDELAQIIKNIKVRWPPSRTALFFDAGPSC